MNRLTTTLAPALSLFRRTVALVLATSILASCAPPDRPAALDPVVVFLVRHAERAEDGTSDPPISQAGEERSRLLARMLADADLTHIHTTAYIRTRATGAPTAEVTGLQMSLYDAADLEGFARQLRFTPGRHLVLGHSNTTPDLVAALGGDPGSPIDEMEYDRLYVVTITRGAADLTAAPADLAAVTADGEDQPGPAPRASTVLLRFGDPYRD
ncbi:MAG: phosphoglycerate mutase family protein [Longimicrobiales bacterium]|nr:phosphoglycerate mutase family protein [Longimicrobiales bacterium]